MWVKVEENESLSLYMSKSVYTFLIHFLWKWYKLRREYSIIVEHGKLCECVTSEKPHKLSESVFLSRKWAQ